MADALHVLTKALGAALAFTLAGGCASDRTNQAGEEMSSALSAANTENDRHAGACRAATSMGDMAADLDRHDETMDGLMSRMDGARDHMRAGSMMSMHCSGKDFEHMSSSLGDMRDEMTGHSARMEAATLLDDARTECGTHTDTMRDTMRSVMDDLHAMPCMGM